MGEEKKIKDSLELLRYAFRRFSKLFNPVKDSDELLVQPDQSHGCGERVKQALPQFLFLLLVQLLIAQKGEAFLQVLPDILQHGLVLLKHMITAYPKEMQVYKGAFTCVFPKIDISPWGDLNPRPLPHWSIVAIPR